MSEFQELAIMLCGVFGAVLAVFSPLLYKQTMAKRRSISPSEKIDQAHTSDLDSTIQGIMDQKKRDLNEGCKTSINLSWREVVTLLGLDHEEVLGISDIEYSDGSPKVRVGVLVQYKYPDPFLGTAVLTDTQPVWLDLPVHEIDSRFDTECIHFTGDSNGLKILTLDSYEVEEEEWSENVILRKTPVRKWNEDKQKLYVEYEEEKVFTGQVTDEPLF